MSNAELSQAIDEAYNLYCTLFYNNAPLAVQEAQFTVYQQLIETVNMASSH